MRLDVLAAAHLELVVHPRARGQLQDDVPQVGAAEPAQRQPVGQPDDAVHEVHGVGVAAPQERAPVALHDRHLVAGQEPVDGGGVAGRRSFSRLIASLMRRRV